MYRNVVEIGQNIFAACATQQVLLLTVCEELAHLLTMSNTHGCPLSSVFFFSWFPDVNVFFGDCVLGPSSDKVAG